MIELKSKEEIAKLREAGEILAGIISELKPEIKAGIETKRLNEISEGLIAQNKCQPAFKGYRGFPASVCVSINEEVVHGIPGNRIIKDGDIVSIDIGLNLDGYFSDAAFTVGIGRIDRQRQRLIDTTKKALDIGISKARAGRHLGDLSFAIQHFVEGKGFSVVRNFVGHGIGKNMHEEPEVPNFGQPRHGPLLKAGMVLAIEPMVNMGTWEVEVLADGWTTVTKDRRPSAHFEHTVAITERGPEVLTRI